MGQQDHGRFDWYELSTTDIPAAIDFYTKVIGWETEQFKGMDYTMFKPADAGSVGGVMPLSDEAKQMGAPPNWLGYIAVGNADATAQNIVSRGGKALTPAFDVPGVGRMQVMADPWGAVFALHEFESDMSPATMPVPGQVCWAELMTDDLDAACDFYSAVFGWTKGQAMDMGEMGMYQLIERGGSGFAGFMKRPPMVPVNYWLYYVSVADLDATLERATAGGGTIIVPPMPIPGGDRIAQFQDPQGAYLAILGK